MKRELAKITASVPTSLGGGKHGHLGLVLPKEKYITMSNGGKEFEIPPHPGHYPENTSSSAQTRAKQEAQHKAKILEHEICAGVISAIKDKIAEAVDREWLEEISNELLGFQNVTIIEMFKHLE